jgi:hypothetical protein
MIYNNLSSSGMSASDRRAEASRIVTMIEDLIEKMTPFEKKFVEQMGDDFVPVSTKQLFWLRDIKDKYL